LAYNDNEEGDEEISRKYALRNINLKIRKCEKIAFVGRTGI
jgi:ABC-type multidrug transport system fused ATPase/permease subunit